MADFLVKILEVIANPTIIVVILCFGLTLLAVWRLFEKQHGFIIERLELLRDENDALRKQLDVFKQENQHLREASAELLQVVENIRKQPLLDKEAVGELRSAREALLKAGPNAEVWTKEIIDQLSRLNESLRQSAAMQISSLERLAHAVPVSGDLMRIVEELIEIVGEGQRRSSENLESLQGRLQRFKRGT